MGKVKTIVQMIAITLLLYQHDLWMVPVFRVGEVLVVHSGHVDPLVYD